MNVYRQNIEELVPHAIHIQKLIIIKLFISSDTVPSNCLCFVWPLRRPGNNSSLAYVASCDVINIIFTSEDTFSF